MKLDWSLIWWQRSAVRSSEQFALERSPSQLINMVFSRPSDCSPLWEDTFCRVTSQFIIPFHQDGHSRRNPSREWYIDRPPSLLDPTPGFVSNLCLRISSRTLLPLKFIAPSLLSTFVPATAFCQRLPATEGCWITLRYFLRYLHIAVQPKFVAVWCI